MELSKPFGYSGALLDRSGIPPVPVLGTASHYLGMATLFNGHNATERYHNAMAHCTITMCAGRIKTQNGIALKRPGTLIGCDTPSEEASGSSEW